ncbi:MAG: sigma-54-dependent Fis family transcriptional regulator [Acidobacteria bacterium]|nr:MAG: sigma-54-dependent Fis family transcriptional regulator [Acidobacteriota bacterium]
MMSTILICDDEAGVRSSLAGVLRDEGYTVDTVDSGEACLDQVTRQAYDVILLDIWLPGIDGLATLERLRERRVDGPVIMISGHGTVEIAVRATRLGAFDFIEKPLSIDKTVLAVRNAIRQRRLEVENRALRARVDRPLVIVGDSPIMTSLREQIAMAAPTNGRVLISGENGTGKELVARQVHAMSHRKQGPFIEVNCAAIPEELIESELFGHLKGAFTGAVADRRGKFELASGGTLFLDEVGDMSLKTQAKVLRALQEQVIEPVGGHSSVRVDVRILAATNKDLSEEIKAGRFREDLFFRLNVIPLAVPPLRERGNDVIRLAEHFISEFAGEYGRRVKHLAPEAQRAMRAYHWPGNVRELRNVIERLMIMVPSDTIAVDDLWFLEGQFEAPVRTPSAAPARPTTPDAVVPLYEARDTWEREYLLKALAAFDGNMSRTADALGVERSNLYRKMRGLGIQTKREDE